MNVSTKNQQWTYLHYAQCSSVSVHLSHLAYFLSTNKYQWLSVFQKAFAVVLLSSPEHGAEKTMHCYPSSIPCIQSISWCSSCECTLLLCLSLQSVCCPEAFAQNKPPHFCWLTLQAMSADFVSQHSAWWAPEGPVHNIFDLMPVCLSCSQHKSGDGCLQLSSIPTLASRARVQQAVLQKRRNIAKWEKHGQTFVKFWEWLFSR